MEKTTKIALITVTSVIITVISYAGFIIYKTWPVSSYTLEKAGAFGDSFGILTSIFSGLAFAGVIWTVLSQLEELSITRDQLKNQGIESALFQMLNIHNEILKEIDLNKENSVGVIKTTGRDVISTFKKRLYNYYPYHEDIEGQASEKEKIVIAYDQFWERHQSELAHYFRFLYNIFRFIDESTSDNKSLYAKLVRAQLSNQELALLFYNCFSSQGANFKKYASKYNLFDNLTAEDLIKDEHFNKLNEYIYN